MYRAFKIEMKMIRRELWKQLRRLTKTVKNENQKHRKFCSKCRKLLANSDTLSGKQKRLISHFNRDYRNKLVYDE